MFKKKISSSKNSENPKTYSPQPFKFGYLSEQGPKPFVYPNRFYTEKTTGPNRLVIAPSENQVDMLLKLTDLLPEPFGILYVLLVPKGSASKPGRYQSPGVSSRAELKMFLKKYESFFELDGRHHIWIVSIPRSETLVYDNHNLLYAYGPLEKYRDLIKKQGLKEEDFTIPAPHVHMYNEPFNSSECEILSFWDWNWFPLEDSDDD